MREQALASPSRLAVDVGLAQALAGDVNGFIGADVGDLEL